MEANAELLAGIQPQLLLTADGSQAIQVFRDTEGAIIAVSNGEYIVKVMGDPTDASNDIALVNKILNDINGTEGTVYVLGDESSATGAVGNAAAARDGIDGSGATIYVYGDGSSARNTINSLTGVQGYATVIVNAVRGTSAGFTDIGLATGGTLYPGMGEYAPSIPSYATGGTHAMVGEHGPEMVWLPNGSQVTNAVATESRRRDRGGGSGITIIGPVTFRVENENVGAAIRSQLLAGGGW